MREEYYGKYSIGDAAGTAFRELNDNTMITIGPPTEGRDPARYATVKLSGGNTADDGSHTGEFDSCGNLVVDISQESENDLPGAEEEASLVAVMSVWIYDPPDKDVYQKFLFGRMYVGDPEGAGGFGGEGDTQQPDD